MDEEQALIEAVIREPDCDVPRLVYADWLDERDGPGDHLHAKFIRDQIAGEAVTVPLTMLTRFEPLLGCQPHQTRRSGYRNYAWVEYPAGPELKWERGFLTTIERLRPERFYGGTCRQCDGTGFQTPIPGWDRYLLSELQCLRCEGAGTLPCLAPVIFANPIERIWLRDLAITIERDGSDWLISTLDTRRMYGYEPARVSHWTKLPDLVRVANGDRSGFQVETPSLSRTGSG